MKYSDMISTTIDDVVIGQFNDIIRDIKTDELEMEMERQDKDKDKDKDTNTYMNMNTFPSSSSMEDIKETIKFHRYI